MKKKIIDVSKPIIKKPVSTALSDDFKELDKKIGKKIEKEIEEFEKKEEEKFKKEEKPKRKQKKFFRVFFLLAIILLFLVGGMIYIGSEFLSKATIKVITKKFEWVYNDSIIADKKGEILPVEIFSIKKNFVFSFRASGKKYVERKASGKIIIYNSFSSTPQPLVAGTRFEAPDKKIFRLSERIVVPGAQVVDGKIVPSNIEAIVIADQAGPQYNIGPVGRFSIPGFSGTPKEQGFYAESKEPMKGGFIGEAAFPTEEDIKKAKERAREELENYINSFFSIQIPQEFKFIDGSRQFNVLKENVNTETDEKDNFAVFTEGELKIIGFKESDLIGLMEKKAAAKLGEKFKIKNYQIEYSNGRADFQKGELSFSLNFRGVFEEPLNIEDFKQKILGKNEKGLKTLISSSYPNIQKTVVSFWPFWIKKVPDNLKRVKVEVE